jgi:hypothetical protein
VKKNAEAFKDALGLIPNQASARDLQSQGSRNSKSAVEKLYPGADYNFKEST